ncbi:MAG: zinc-dependent metalloprotease [Candidatus Limnocylindrales bacterium]
MTLATTARRLGSSRAVRIGVAIGLGMTARAIASRATVDVRGGLVDWERAERIARRRLRNVPGRLTPAQLRASEAAYARHMGRVVPLLEARLGAELPGVVERHAVVSRSQWAAANMVTFKALIGHLEPHLTPGLPEGSVRAGFAAATNRLVTTGQVGFLLGYLGSRVLGQYDVAMLSAEQEPGRLLYVEENIRATARLVRVPVDDFRLWVALHETTHAFELEAHPWLRPYIRSRMERQVALFARETRRLQRHGLAHLARRWRSAAAEGSFRGFLSPEQRQLFKETQLVMSLMEGFSDWVMDDVGAELLPDVEAIRRRFEARRGQRRRAFDRLMARVTGMDIKLEQYRRGERFVSGVYRVGGPAAIKHLWDGPETLPSDEEMDDPAAWVRRVVPAAVDAGGAT